MKVLIACEFSGAVRRAFRERGHEAWSCDLLPAEDGSPFHYQCDAIQAMNLHGGWDLAVTHAPCRFLNHAGVRWLYETGRRWIKDNDGNVIGENPIDEMRWLYMQRAAQFFRELLNGPVPRIAAENSEMHPFALKIIGRKPDQEIQPWQFGHGEVKATCLWLKNLPPLKPTNIVEGREPRVHHAKRSPDRWKERSRTLPGIAAAMAEQWGGETFAQQSLFGIEPGKEFAFSGPKIK